MHTRCVTVLLLFSACVAGQPGPVANNLKVTLTEEGDNQTFHVRNEYSSPATAWILLCETAQGGSRYYWKDEDLSLRTTPIAPAQEIEFKFPSMPPQMTRQMADAGTCSDFHAVAAIFADGTVSGDLRWINAIVSEHRQAFQQIAKASAILNDAISDGADTAAVVQQLTDWGNSDNPSGRGARPTPTHGPAWGFQSRGSAPPMMRTFRSPVPGAALWLLSTQQMKLPDALKALSEWSDRLARLAGVSDKEGPSAAPTRMLSMGSFTPPSEPDFVGKPAPAFVVRDVDGHPVTLSGLHGKPVLLDFWATWCEPCRESMPYVQSLYDRFKDKGLVVLGIDTNESAEKARDYFAAQKFSFANLLGTGSDIVRNYGANAIPRLLLIDKDGIVRYVHRGWGPNIDLTPEVQKLVER